VNIKSLFTLRVRLWALLGRTAAIAFIGSGIGLAYNTFSDAGIPLKTPAKQSASEAQDWRLHVQGFRATLSDTRQAFDGRETVFIDARSPSAYRAGHIPGAHNLPVSNYWTYAKDVLEGLPKDTPIITYCSGGSCLTSVTLAEALQKKYGFTDVRAFYKGWSAWIATGYPSVKGDAP
jgi:rhodanese-related sulfurtransferase